MHSELLYKFFNGTASEKETGEIKAWLDREPSNYEDFMRERKLFDATIVHKDRKEIKAEINRRNLSVRRGFRRAMGIAAIFAVAFIAGWFISGPVGALTAQSHRITVPAGQRINVRLPDGSDVWLNGRTTLEYPGSFSGRSREVILDGQAYFDVSHNKSKPFVVNTSKGSVEVLGTRFDVKAYSDRDEFETVLVEGRVKVQLADDPSQVLVLTPDMKAYVTDGKLARVYVRDYNPYRWKDGLICFSNATFGDIVKELETNYDVQVMIRGNETPEVSYTGKFRINDGIDYALRVLQKDVNFSFSRSENHNIIYIDIE